MADAAVTFLRVADMARSHAFYGDVLGLDLVLDQGGCRIYRIAGDAFVGICEREDPGSEGMLLTFVTDDVGGWHDRIVAAGGEVDGPPRDNADYRIHHFFAEDPDGNALEIQRFWDEDWSEPLG